MSRTPGTLYEANMGNDHQGLIIEEVSGKNIAVTYEKEHAAFIVLAVNSHDALVEALRKLTNEVNGWTDSHQLELREIMGQCNLTVLKMRITEARAALKLAEG